MRLFFAIIIIALSSASVFGQQAEFGIDKAVVKFPKTIEGELLTHYYTITNEGDVPLILSDYKVGCSCTKVYLPKKPIAPGESFKLKVTFDTKGKWDWQDRTIYIKDNTRKGKHMLRFKVRVIPAEQ